ncbi:MAG: 30S ribosomal protein S12 methylthiotransferase RimO [Clostridia bacterium]|nr:30S ribosomal protein S12 methylthiotransferase RimO [Clostridia bacterium]
MTKEELLTKKVSAISLGCDKNRVDLENMLGKIKHFGFEITEEIEDANIIIVNTCAFIQPAVKEGIDNILLALKQKKNACEKVIVCGCIVERYENEISKEIPEVDAYVKVSENSKIVEKILELYEVDAKIKETSARVLTTAPHIAYLKIADGCDNCCSYCTIPRIRGRYKSTPIDDLVKEAKNLAEQGVKELIVVAQDTTRYGTDIYDKPMLVPLLEKLCQIKEIKWIRLHYLYPEMVNVELLNFIVNQPKICDYIDIPLQHIDEKILKSMNRRNNEEQARELVKMIKENYPQITVRTTFIVGYPGESKKQFKKLVQFLKDNNLENVGFFPYYKEEKTKAYFLKKQNTNYKKLLRLKKIQKVQYQIANNINSSRVGEEIMVLVDKFDNQTGYYICHDEANSPNIDFEILLDGNSDVVCGNFYKVKLVDYQNQTFIGEVL